MDVVGFGIVPLPQEGTSWKEEKDSFLTFTGAMTKASESDTNVRQSQCASRENGAINLISFPMEELLERIQKLLSAQEARIIEAVGSSPGALSQIPGSFSMSSPVALSQSPGAFSMGLESAPCQSDDQSSATTQTKAKNTSLSPSESTHEIQKDKARSDKIEQRMKEAFSTRSRTAQSTTSMRKAGSQVSMRSSLQAMRKSARASLAIVKFENTRKKTKVSEEMVELTRLANEISQQGNTLALRNTNFGAHFSLNQGYTNAVYNVMNSRQIELVISAMIVLNAIVIGAQVDEQMRNAADASTPAVFRFFDVFFLVVFTIELVMRLVGERPMEFLSWRNEKFSWNIFDAILVASAFGEEVMTAFLDSTPDVSTLRLFRILRLVRVFRIIRVMRFFRDLRIMVAGIAQSMQSLVWALLLLFCIMYLVAVCVLQLAVEESEKRASSDMKEDAVLSDSEYNTLQTYFGSLHRTLYTLYLSITGGVDWGDAADPLFGLTWFLGVFFGVYIAFSVLCVLNIVTGVFVENCNKMTAKDQDMVLMEQLDTRRAWFEEVKSIFDTVDENGNGVVDPVEFVNHLEGDVRMQAWLRKLGVHVEAHSAEQLFALLDLDGDGQLDFDEFASALQQVHGSARSIDLARIKHDTRMLRESQCELMELCNRIFQKVDSKNDQVKTSKGWVVGGKRVGEYCDEKPSESDESARADESNRIVRVAESKEALPGRMPGACWSSGEF